MLLKKLKETFIPQNNQSISQITSLLRDFEKSKKELFICDKISPVSILSDNKTLYTKDAGLVQVIKLDGKDYSGISQREQEKLFVTRMRFFETLPIDITATFHYHRKKIVVNGNSKSLGGDVNKYSSEITRMWNKKFKGSYKTEMYLVVRMESSIKIDNFLEIINSDLIKDQIKLDKKREELNSEISKISKMLESYNPSVLVHTKDNKSELINFFDYLINSNLLRPQGEENKLILKSNNNISNILSLTDISLDKKEGLAVLSSHGKTKLCKILAVKYYPDDKISDRTLESLLRVKHQFNIVQHVLPVERESNKLYISRRINEVKTMTFGFMASRMKNLEEAGDALEKGEVNYHDHIILIYVYGDNEKELTSATRDIQGILNNNGVTLIPEGLNIELAYWSSLPDGERFSSARKGRISTANLSNFITLGTSLEGLPKCSFGDSPVTTFKTTQNTNYSFTFHNSTNKEALGNTLIIGESGSGKTTLISFLLMSCLKYKGFKTLAFDSLNGIKIPVTAFGGDYIDTGKQKKLNLNPFLLSGTDRNKKFLKDFIEILINGARNNDEQNLIGEIIKQNYELSPSERNLGIIRSICGTPSTDNNNQENITARIEQWLPEQEGSEIARYSNLFNAKKDSLSFEKSIVAFDMIDAMKNPAILAPLSSYIFHSFDEYIENNPSPHACFIDEMATYIQNETFAKFINKSAQQWRKRRGIIIGAVQNPKSLIKSEFGKEIISNIATYILFPDVTAEADDYIGAMGLNDSEFNWIKTPNPERQVMIKRRGGESIIVDVDLACLGENINLFSSGHEYSSKLIRIEREQERRKKEDKNYKEEEHEVIEEYLRSIR
jgi:type IV secretion/conjugal transfer VirB4 family ATPase